jgi:DNA-binding response OmpR family regulator
MIDSDYRFAGRKDTIAVIPVKANILLIEGKRAEHPSFFMGLTRKGFHVESVSSGSKALDRLSEKLPHLVLIDAASMRTSGKRICQSIQQVAPGVPVVLVVEKDHNGADKFDANVVLAQPFTLQKLLNRIRPLLPTEDKNLLVAGPLELDMDQRWVRSQDRQTSLTPRLVNLLQVLIKRKGEVIDRRELFRLVWDTGYTGDTRTLDVHISWLRQAIEEDPRHPRLIKTVRGVGYRLDVDPDNGPSHLNSNHKPEI